MEFPVIETRRFILRELQPEDAVTLYAYFSLDEVTQYYDLDSFTEIKQAADLIASWKQNRELGNGCRWGIARRDDDLVVGTCGFHKWSREHRKAEIGYELAPAFWRQGIMNEAMEAVLDYGFGEMELHRVEAFIDPENEASEKVLVRQGFHREGYLRECFYEKGRWVDALLYSLLAGERLRE